MLEEALYWLGAVVTVYVVSGIVYSLMSSAYAFFLHSPKLKKYGEWAGARISKINCALDIPRSGHRRHGRHRQGVRLAG